jgi:hypothetical protein
MSKRNFKTMNEGNASSTNAAFDRRKQLSSFRKFSEKTHVLRLVHAYVISSRAVKVDKVIKTFASVRFTDVEISVRDVLTRNYNTTEEQEFMHAHVNEDKTGVKIPMRDQHKDDIFLKRSTIKHLRDGDVREISCRTGEIFKPMQRVILYDLEYRNQVEIADRKPDMVPKTVDAKAKEKKYNGDTWFLNVGRIERDGSVNVDPLDVMRCFAAEDNRYAIMPAFGSMTYDDVKTMFVGTDSFFHGGYPDIGDIKRVRYLSDGDVQVWNALSKRSAESFNGERLEKDQLAGVLDELRGKFIDGLIQDKDIPELVDMVRSLDLHISVEVQLDKAVAREQSPYMKVQVQLHFFDGDLEWLGVCNPVTFRDLFYDKDFDLACKIPIPPLCVAFRHVTEDEKEKERERRKKSSNTVDPKAAYPITGIREKVEAAKYEQREMNKLLSGFSEKQPGERTLYDPRSVSESVLAHTENYGSIINGKPLCILFDMEAWVLSVCKEMKPSVAVRALVASVGPKDPSDGRSTTSPDTIENILKGTADVTICGAYHSYNKMPERTEGKVYCLSEYNGSLQQFIKPISYSKVKTQGGAEIAVPSDAVHGTDTVLKTVETVPFRFYYVIGSEQAKYDMSLLSTRVSQKLEEEGKINASAEYREDLTDRMLVQIIAHQYSFGDLPYSAPVFAIRKSPDSIFEELEDDISESASDAESE